MFLLCRILCLVSYTTSMQNQNPQSEQNNFSNLLKCAITLYLLMMCITFGISSYLMLNLREGAETSIRDTIEKEVDRSYTRFFTQFNFAVFLIGTSVWVLRQSVINSLQTELRKQFKEDFDEELKSLKNDLASQRQKDEIIQEISNFLPSTSSFFQEEIKPEIKSMLQELITKLQSLRVENSRLYLTFEDYTKWGDSLFYLANYQVLATYKSTNSWFNEISISSRIGKDKKIIAQYKEAILKYDEAIGVKETYYAWLGSGNALRMLGDYGEAIKCYDRAIQLERLPFVALVNKGLVHRRLYTDEKEGIREGIKCFDEAISIAPNYPRAWYNKACYCAFLNDSKKALENLEKAINLAPLKAKELAAEDSDFNLIKEDEEFKKLLH